MLSLTWKTNSVHAVHSSVQNKIQMAFILQKKKVGQTDEETEVLSYAHPSLNLAKTK